VESAEDECRQTTYRQFAIAAVILSCVTVVALATTLSLMYVKLSNAEQRVMRRMEKFNAITDSVWRDIVDIQNRVVVKRDGSGYGGPSTGYNQAQSAPNPGCVRCVRLECPRGTPGPPGSAGQDGVPGKPGIQGKPGLDGFDVQLEPEPDLPCVICPAGPNGLRGPQGERGREGAKGVPGHPGLPSKNGYPGSPGTYGQQGQRGPLGDAGIKGPPGDDILGGIGVKGPRGPPGPRGPKGPPGVPGRPSNELGYAGQLGAIGQYGVKGGRGQPGPPGGWGPPGQPGMPADYCPSDCGTQEIVSSDAVYAYPAGPAPSYGQQPPAYGGPQPQAQQRGYFFWR